MAKSRPPGGGSKLPGASKSKSGLKRGGAPEAEKITPRSFIGALPCMVIVLVGIGLLSMFFYALLTSSLKSGVAK